MIFWLPIPWSLNGLSDPYFSLLKFTSGTQKELVFVPNLRKIHQVEIAITSLNKLSGWTTTQAKIVNWSPLNLHWKFDWHKIGTHHKIWIRSDFAAPNPALLFTNRGQAYTFSGVKWTLGRDEKENSSQFDITFLLRRTANTRNVSSQPLSRRKLIYINLKLIHYMT